MRSFSILVFLLIGSFAFGQRTADTKDVLASFDKKSFDAIQLTIDAEPDRVQDLWEEFWQDRYDIDIDKEDKSKGSITYLGEQVSLPLVSEKNFNLYSKVGGSAMRTLVDMAVTFSDNDAVTADNHERSYAAMQALMSEFRTYFYTEYFDDKLEEVRGDLGDVRDDSQDASKDASKARKKIKKYEDKIADYERKIEKLRAEVGDEMETAEEKARKAKEIEQKVREIERMRAKYLGN